MAEMNVDLSLADDTHGGLDTDALGNLEENIDTDALDDRAD